MTKTFIGLVTGLLLSGCATNPGDPTAGALRPSDLLRNIGKYDGQHVTVVGYVVVGPERRIIADSEADVRKSGVACLGLDGPRKYFENFHSARDKVSGTFKKDLCGPNDVCLYWCGDAGLVLDEK